MSKDSVLERIFSRTVYSDPPTSKRNSLDYYNVPVWSIKKGLELAYQAGYAARKDEELVLQRSEIVGRTRRNAGIVVVNKRSKRSVPISVHATLEAGQLEDYGSELDELASKLIQEAYELGKLYNISWNSLQPIMHSGKVGISGMAYEPDLTNYTRAVRDAYNSQNYASVDVEIAVG